MHRLNNMLLIFYRRSLLIIWTKVVWCLFRCIFLYICQFLVHKINLQDLFIIHDIFSPSFQQTFCHGSWYVCSFLSLCYFSMARKIVDAILDLSLDDSPSNLAAATLFYILTSDVSIFFSVTQSIYKSFLCCLLAFFVTCILKFLLHQIRSVDVHFHERTYLNGIYYSWDWGDITLIKPM